MEGLQRSTTSFRRQGSSGLVWDDKYLSGDLNRFRNNNKKNNKEADDDINKQKAVVMTQRNRSEGGGVGGGGGGGGRVHRAVKELPPDLDPPSPKVSGCGLCGFFGKPATATAHKPKSNKRNSTTRS